MKPRAVVLYHYFYPDDVVSARHLTDLAVGLVERGWEVEAWPCHRGCRDEAVTHALRERALGVDIRRVWRPKFKQASNAGRLLNAGWMLAAWAYRALVTPRRKREVVVVGTDPILSVLTALPWKFFRNRSAVAHWCFDLYPEAAVADGLVRPNSTALKVIDLFLTGAYRKCGLLADLGPCMANLLATYRSPANTATLVPWALIEPPTVGEPMPEVRAKLFGPQAKIGLLYSGSFGRAHGSSEFLELARYTRGTGVEFCFAGRGNRMDELKLAVSAEDTNVRFAGFAPEVELEQRLTACDLHLVSLRSEWTGTVVPSKFFGALAAGRGVVFAGSPDCAIAKWIAEHRVGWVLAPGTASTVANDLLRFAADATAQAELKQRCHAVYTKQFSRATQLDRWDVELRKLLRG